MKVLVTCPPMLGLFDEFRPELEAAGLDGVPAAVTQVMTEDELIEVLPAYDGWIIGDDPASARVFEAAHAGKLRAAVKWGVGVDNVDFAACHALDIPITNTPGVFGREVADVAMGYVLGLARHTFEIDRAIRNDQGWPKPPGISLWNKTAALVGFGDIGQATAKRLLAADLKVIAYDPFYKPVEGLDVETAAWPERLEEADFLIFTCPLTPDTHHMFNHALLPRLKPGVRVVNVARGPIIEQAALVDGLEDGLVHSAALDVFEDEPLAADNPLRRFPNTIFGSHNGSNTVDAVRHVSRLAIQKIADFLKT
ncbi:MAG: phosphoglycerate dehydrogenase [Pseudomonadota bacterium]